MGAQIIGWSHGRFGKRQEGLEALIAEVAAQAIGDAGLEPEDIDCIYLGTLNAGLDSQEFASSLVMQAVPALRFTPTTRVENACASGSAAVYQGAAQIEAGLARTALVIGAEKMTHLGSAQVGDCLKRASYQPEEADIEGGFAGVFAHITDLYFQRHGDQSDALARIAAKNHANGVDNPFAHVRKDLGYEFCRGGEGNPRVAGALRRTDCSMISDGAAALVLANDEIAAGARHAVAFRARSQVNDYLPMSRRDVADFPGPTLAWSKALQQAGVDLSDLSLVEVHDCFTIAELLAYEAMGLTRKGQGARAIDEGWTARDGRLPVNPSGGLKAKGHPIGATGVSMHVLGAMQLANEAGGIQVPGAALAGVFNMGGSAVASYVSILERAR